LERDGLVAAHHSAGVVGTRNTKNAQEKKPPLCLDSLFKLETRYTEASLIGDHLQSTINRAPQLRTRS
jgi:hypothetical protein